MCGGLGPADRQNSDFLAAFLQSHHDCYRIVVSPGGPVSGVALNIRTSVNGLCLEDVYT